MNNFLLPSAESVTANPHKMLPKLLHQQGNGVGRAYQDATLLADAILEAAVVIEDFLVPWRPALSDSLLEGLLADENARFESREHRELKVHARIVALAANPSALLEPESKIGHERFALRPDLIVWSAFGVSESYECGATDGRGVYMQLLSGQIRVTVLPFSGLNAPGIRGYVFRFPTNPPMPEITAEAAQAAWNELVATDFTTDMLSINSCI